MASGSNTAIIAALIANFAIAISKFAGAAITGSSAMIAEGIHSFVDTGNQWLLFLGIKKSRKEPDKEHPFGHGKEFYFWTLIVAILLFSLGGGMSIYEGIVHLRRPEMPGKPVVNYIILGVGFVFEGTSWVIAYSRLRKGKYIKGRGLVQALHSSKDPSVFVVLYEDSAALSGLIVATAGIFLSTVLNNPIYDGIASLVIGVILAAVAFLLADESRSLLIGESAHGKLVDEVTMIMKNDPAVLRYNSPLTMHFGPDEILLALEAEFKKGEPGDTEKAIENLEKKIRESFPEIKKIFIEARSLRS
jgi:cation diffusion facilitator family transporter